MWKQCQGRTAAVPAGLLAVLSMLVGAAGVAAIAAEPDLPAGVSRDWWTAVQQRIADEEYHVTWQDGIGLPDLDAAWQAPNRAQGFRTYFTEQGIRVRPRIERDDGWEWGLELAGWGRGEQTLSARPPSISTFENRVDCDRGDLVEWYVNSPRGLEQGFTLPEPPAVESDGEDAGPLHLDLVLSGTLRPVFSDDGQAIDFRSRGNVAVLHYGSLHVTDARGRELPARFEGHGEGTRFVVRIVVEDGGAAWPVTVDPLATTPSWSAVGEAFEDNFGEQVTAAGDVDGDGFGDVLVAASSAENLRGRVYLYRGSSSGLAETPRWTLDGEHEGDRFGMRLGAAGDLNGDGYADFAVGAPNVTDDPPDYHEWIYIYHGSADGPVLATSFDATDVGCGDGVVFSAGDVNGDGYSDLVAARRDLCNVCVWHGGPAGIGDEPNWRSHFPDAEDGGCLARYAGDVNGDGYGDLVVGGPYHGEWWEGRVDVFLGSPTGLAETSSWQKSGDQEQGNLGMDVATAGDVDGDGYSDIVVGEPGRNLFNGAIHVFYGSAGGMDDGRETVIEGDPQEGDEQFGHRVAPAGDVNGDGYSDVITGTRDYSGGDDYYDQGGAWVYLGTPYGLRETPAWHGEGNQDYSNYGDSVMTAGDVNGDGFSDIIVGAWKFDDAFINQGAAFVYHGGADDIRYPPSWDYYPGQDGALLGYSVASAGDVDGDGYGDVIVGVRDWDGGQADEGGAFLFLGSGNGLSGGPDWRAGSDQSGARLGFSVASAGDIDGDGYSDVVAAAPYFDNHGSPDHGAVFLWRGSPFGLGPDGSPGNADWRADGLQQSAYFGYSVASAGDLNGDGYGDLVIGTPYYDDGETDEGGVFVWMGSSSGLGDNGVPSNADWRAHSNQVGGHLGVSVAGIGDVNGDGFGDLAAGADRYDDPLADEGAVFAWYGSRSGPGPDGTPANAGWEKSSGQAGAYFGRAVAGAGDVNGDGYSDLLVGGHGYDGNYTDEGRIWLYEGSADGLPTGAATIFNGGQEGAAFGFAVAGAGDVNGDGYADILVGAYLHDGPETDSGRASLWYGSAAGISLTDAVGWYHDGSHASAWFGRSVAGAGDVNGDGFADLLIGEPGWEIDGGDRGRAAVWYGGDGGRVVLPEQRITGGGGMRMLIDRFCRSDSEDAFKISLRGRGLVGRGEIKLEWEVAPTGDLLDGSGLGSPSAWTDSTTGFAVLNELVDGLPSGALHWRARVRQHPADSPWQFWGRWYAPPWGGWNEADLRLFHDPDGDGLSDEQDNCPGIGNPGQEDMDGDGTGDVCDPDRDGDLWGNDQDCRPDDPSLWSAPSVVRDLMVTKDPVDNLSWTDPADHGTTGTLYYDVLTSRFPDDWSIFEAECVESDDTDTVATETSTPQPGKAFHYLVRAENPCGSNMGTDTAGTPRTGRSCP